MTRDNRRFQRSWRGSGVYTCHDSDSERTRDSFKTCAKCNADGYNAAYVNGK